ncbi:hypothetical protein HZC07_02400 [Candidatus Micrarchaeota archaeon]|nr:hypothetical protein [Candidatus Micrarchaeota archaeon]
METIDFATVVSIINSILLIFLLAVYVKNYKAMKSKFSLGLAIFALMLLAQNLASIYFQTAMIDYYSKTVSGFALVLNVLESLSLLSLVYITWKPCM